MNDFAWVKGDMVRLRCKSSCLITVSDKSVALGDVGVVEQVFDTRTPEPNDQTMWPPRIGPATWSIVQVRWLRTNEVWPTENYTLRRVECE